MSLALDGIESPQRLSFSSLPADLFDPTEEKTQEIANKILNIDLAKAMIQAGSGFEEVSTEKLHAMELESNEIIESIDLLLDFSREASSLNAESPKITEKMRSINKQLQERGINLLNLPEGKEIDKEQLASVKSATGSHIDKLRTKIQQIFTKMQTVIQNMSSVNDSIKKMINEQSDLIRKVLERSIKH
jgi:hypothetical protein